MSSSVTERDGTPDEYLTFFVQGEEYAVGLRRVREVIQYDAITRVPRMPPAMRGITNVRGQVVPVLDLTRKFHGDDTPVDRRTCIVLVEAVHDGAPMVIGLMTEAVGQVLALSAAEIAAPPAFGTPIKSELLIGMGRIGKKFALMLDIDRLLDPAELLATEPEAEAVTVAGPDVPAGPAAPAASSSEPTS